MKHIIIVEDNLELAKELKTLLTRNNYSAEYVEDFGDVVGELTSKPADMILLDINLPGADGTTILKQLRAVSDTPVIMVTSKNTDMDELLSMSFGADDFIAKPYNPSILLLHIEAVFKRSMKQTEAVYRYEDIVVDPERGIMTVGEEVVELTKNEMGILTFMFKNKGKIVSRDELISYLWDSDEFVDDNTLTVNINRVRHKLEEYGHGDVIKTKRGQGYIIE